MEKKILIRYGELSLKGKNKMTFVRCLEKNMIHFYGLIPEVFYDHMLLPCNDLAFKKLSFVIGIHSYAKVMIVDNNIDTLKKTIIYLSKNLSGTFKIKTSRSSKKYSLNSMQINSILGEIVLNNNNKLKVDIKFPNYLIEVEIREQKAFVFYEKFPGIGGLPVGSNGKILHLISGGIDSPVAAFNLMKRGLHVDFITFISPPQTDNKMVDKVKSFLKILGQYQGNSNLYLSNFSTIMSALSLTSKQSYKITLMRRSFYRVATTFANNHGYLAISNGDNLGQVASQTLESISTIQNATNLPILRPLLTYDKMDTIRIAKQIGTYDISIIHANETCELFAPKNPIIKPNFDYVQKLEKDEYPDIEKMENELLENGIETIII